MRSSSSSALAARRETFVGPPVRLEASDIRYFLQAEVELAQPLHEGGLAKRLLVVPAVARHRIDAGRLENADLMVVAKGFHAQTADEGEVPDAVFHIDGIVASRTSPAPAPHYSKNGATA